MQMDAQPEKITLEHGLQILIDNVPGGMFSCRFDEPLTLLQVNEGFLSMLGYTREELRTIYRDSIWEMIDPRDRERALRDVRRQLALGPTKELEYRMSCKDGTVIWLLDKGRLIRGDDGAEAFCCLLVDISRSKELESKLRLSLERHQLIMDQTADIIIEWDIQADTIYYSHNWEKKFGYAPLTKDVSVNLPNAFYIHEEDRERCVGLLEQIRHGMRYGETELRIMKTRSTSIWCKLRLTGQQDESGRVVKAVGVIIDIDEEKRRSERLLETARKDALTQIYNKGAVQELITERLAGRAPETIAALLILDLDNFKQVNDTMGHLFGDALLIETARTIEEAFEKEDLVGRIGGDEFIVYLHDAPDRAAVEERAGRLVRAFDNLRVKELPRGSVSCSVGVAICPDCGSDYRSLFQAADEALYQAKKLGKNRYAVRNAQQWDPVLSGGPVSAVNARIDSEEECKPVGGQFAEHIFQILYKSTDIEGAVNTILEIVGRYFDVSRVYIFENSEDDLYCCNTFEWCNDGVKPEIQSLQKLSYEKDLDHFLNSFNEEGVFYCRDIHMLSAAQYQILSRQGIKSVLQCAIYSDGKIRGYVGFDECRAVRFWTQEQVDTLSLVAKVLSTFLLKQRAQERVTENAQALEAILDSQSAWIYVIDPETYSVRYANRKMLELIPDVIGTKCYASFQGCGAPCPFCPIQELNATGANVIREIYNRKFQVWSSTEASHIRWRGEDAILLVCHDITGLKTGAPPPAPMEG